MNRNSNQFNLHTSFTPRASSSPNGSGASGPAASGGGIGGQSGFGFGGTGIQSDAQYPSSGSTCSSVSIMSTGSSPREFPSPPPPEKKKGYVIIGRDRWELNSSSSSEEDEDDDQDDKGQGMDVDGDDWDNGQGGGSASRKSCLEGSKFRKDMEATLPPAEQVQLHMSAYEQDMSMAMRGEGPYAFGATSTFMESEEPTTTTQEMQQW